MNNEFFALHITWTCYGTWLPRDPRGHVSNQLTKANVYLLKQNIPGTPPASGDAWTWKNARSHQKGESVLLTANLAEVVCHSMVRAAKLRDWRILRAAGQWLALQAPLWFLSASYGLQIHYRGKETETSIRPLQFGTRQLMIVTAIVAVFLGVGRALLTTIDASSDTFAFLFLAVAGILMSLPLLLACLLPRWAVRSVLILLALIAAATWGEYPLLQELGGDGPEFWHFVWINFFQSAWIVFVITLLRAFGYGCGNPHAPAPKASFDS